MSFMGLLVYICVISVVALVIAFINKRYFNDNETI